MNVYPAFLRLDGLPVLVVGAGQVAASKIGGLLAAGARVTVVAPAVSPPVRLRGVTVVERGFEPADLDGMRWVVAAATPEVNARVAAEAEARAIFVNAVDDTAASSAYLGGVVRRGDVTLAISTGGRAPALAGLLREALEAVLPIDLERWMTIAREARLDWLRRGLPMGERRPLLLRALNEMYSRRVASPRAEARVDATLERGAAERLGASRRRDAAVQK
jgi:uroporphyrin-III C-methyltransferase/precorrin-2 dehydrogenase/sirohydrochlorin ferrochelatase